MAKLKTKDLVVGEKYKIIANHYIQNGFPKDTIVTMVMANQGNILVTNDSGQQIYIRLGDIAELIQSKESIELKLKDLQRQVDLEKGKLEWMNNLGYVEYNENEFKVWSTLKTLASSSTDEEKAKIIASLINS
jgi:hypothetical protein